MIEVISIIRRTARKVHECNACLWLQEADDLAFLTFAEKRAVVVARRSEWKIRIYEAYDEVVLKDEYGLCRVCRKPAIHDICVKYDLYPDE